MNGKQWDGLLLRDPDTGDVEGTVLGSITTAQNLDGYGELDQDSASYGGTALYINAYQRDDLSPTARPN